MNIHTVIFDSSSRRCVCQNHLNVEHRELKYHVQWTQKTRHVVRSKYVQIGIASIRSEASSCCVKRCYVSLLYCISTKVIGLSWEFHWITSFRTSQCWLCSNLCRWLLPTTQWGRQFIRRDCLSDCIWCRGDWTYRLIPTDYTDFRDFRRQILVSTKSSVWSNCSFS